MKFQLAIAFILFACLLVSPGFSSETPNEISLPTTEPSKNKPNEFANINKGDFRLGGGISFGYSTYSQMIFSVAPNFSYFVADNFAIGLDLSGSFSKNHTYLNAGPSVTYYFATFKKWAFFGEQALSYHSYEDRSDFSYFQNRWSSRTSLGANYFFLPQIGFGPMLSFDKDLSGTTNDTMSLTGNFSIYF
jgi:hypothetical protein